MRGLRGWLILMAAIMLVGCCTIALVAQTPRALEFRGITLHRSYRTAPMVNDSVDECVSVAADGAFRWERQRNETNQTEDEQPSGIPGLTTDVSYTDIFEGKLAPADLEALLAAINSEAFNAVPTQPRPERGGESISIDISRAAGAKRLEFWGKAYRKQYKALEPLFTWWTRFDKQKLVRSKTNQRNGCRMPGLSSGARRVVTAARPPAAITPATPREPGAEPCPAVRNPSPVTNDAQPMTATLYSVIVYKDQSKGSFNFEHGQYGTRIAHADLTYGTLSISEDWDWFSPSRSYGKRGRIRDLREANWSDPVPDLPLPPELTAEEIKAGKRPVITVDSSAGRYEGWQQQAASDGTFVKALVGHMYALHVKDSCAEYYVQFRVESLERGDHCTISWRRIPSPSTP